MTKVTPTDPGVIVKRTARWKFVPVVVLLLSTLLTLAPAPATAAPKDPVIIVAGTVSPAFASEPLRARLLADGYNAYIFELPGLGIGDIAQTSAPLAPFVNNILASTGASKVDLIGHSQGGLVARYYVKNLGGSAKVDSLISLGAPHYGTALANLGNVLGISGLCQGCEQMSVGSSFLNSLNAGDDTIGTVKYTNIYTVNDEIVFPWWNSKLNDGATNVKVQSQCWFKFVGHLGLIVDGAVYSGVQDALANRSITLNCWAW